MDEPCHVWVSHVIYEWVMSHCHIWMSVCALLCFIQVTSHMNETWHGCEWHDWCQSNDIAQNFGILSHDNQVLSHDHHMIIISRMTSEISSEIFHQKFFFLTRNFSWHQKFLMSFDWCRSTESNRMTESYDSHRIQSCYMNESSPQSTDFFLFF